jgi:hypothetical protein
MTDQAGSAMPHAHESGGPVGALRGPGASSPVSDAAGIGSRAVAAQDGMFKFAGRVVATDLRRGSSVTGALADDPFFGDDRAQAIAIRYPIIFPMRVVALATYLNSTVPEGITVTVHLVKGNVSTPIRNLYPSLSFGGVQTSSFVQPVAFARGDQLDLMVTIYNEFGETRTYEAPCSATIGFKIDP